MYSYVLEFNLARHGDDAEEYLHDAARLWPKLWADIPGVQGTLLLSSALALGGEFDYQWRVDIEALSTLARIDETIKAADGGWRRSTEKYYAARTASRASVSRHVAGDEAYSRSQKGTDGAIHLVVHSGAESARLADRVDAVRSASGVLSAQALQPVLATGQEQLWLRLEALDALDGLDEVVRADLGGGARLFGELREVDGALFAGA